MHTALLHDVEAAAGLLPIKSEAHVTGETCREPESPTLATGRHLGDRATGPVPSLQGAANED
jgi:hypothetical protein